MGAGKAEKGENTPLTSSDKAIDDLTLASPKVRPPIPAGTVRVKTFQPSIGFWMRLYLRLEAVGLSLAANWREDCEHRNARFLWCALAMAFGAASYYSLPDEPSLMILLGLVAVSVSWVWRRARKGAVDFLLLLVVSAGIGLSVASYQGQFSSTPVLTRAFSSPVTGVIDHIDYRQKNGRKDERWTLRVEAIDRIGSDPKPERLLLVRKALGARFDAGERVKLWARMQPLQRPAFPGAFDYARYLWARSIGGQGYMGREIERLPKMHVSGLSGLWAEAKHRIESLRNSIAEQIAARMKGEAGGLAIALAVGKRDYLSNDVKDALRQSGLAHILAISGLHMALVAMSIFWGARALFALVPSLALSYPIKQWAAGIALLCAFGYLVLSGNSVATIRAFLMTAIILLAILLGRPALTLHNLALALIVVIVVQPYSLVEAGMQMSFGATAALIASYDRLRTVRIRLGVKQEATDTHHHPKGLGRMRIFVRTALRWVGGIGATSLIAGLAVLPFSIAHFQQMAPLGLLANLMVMPIVTLVVMPLGLVSILLVPIGLQSLTLPLVAWGLEQVIASARWIVEQSDDRLLVVSGQGMVLSMIVLALAAYAIHRRGLALLGIVPIVAALLVWQMTRPADLWISDNGARVAYRGTDQRWHLLGSSRITIDYASLLHFDGDARLLKAARSHKAGKGVEKRTPVGRIAQPVGGSKENARDTRSDWQLLSGCDKAACFARDLARRDGHKTGLSIGLVRKASAFDEVCADRDIVVSKLPIPASCTKPRYRIGPDTLQKGGARFIWFDRIAKPVGIEGGIKSGKDGQREERTDEKQGVAEQPMPKPSTPGASIKDAPIVQKTRADQIKDISSGESWMLREVAAFIVGRRPWR